MSENQPITVEEISDAPSGTNLLFSEPDKENVNISSGKNDQTKSEVKIETNIVNSVLGYMLAKGRAWSSMEQSFIHFSMLFMSRDWHSENDLANKINESFEKAPFSVARTKTCLDELAKLKILEVKSVKGKNKYKITDMGISMLIHDRVIAKTLGMDKPANVQQQVNNDNSPKPSAELISKTGPTEEPKLVEQKNT